MGEVLLGLETEPKLRCSGVSEKKGKISRVNNAICMEVKWCMQQSPDCTLHRQRGSKFDLGKLGPDPGHPNHMFEAAATDHL